MGSDSEKQLLVLSLEQLAELTQSELKGNSSTPIYGVEDLSSAGPQHVSFLENPRYEPLMRKSTAGAIFVQPSTALVEGKNYLLTETPSLAFQKAIEFFLSLPSTSFSDIHPTAVIHPSAQLAEHISVGPHAVIDQGVKIGAGTTIGPGVIIGAGTSLGENCYIHANVVIREGCRLGNRVTLQPGAIIGSCGYGYFTDKKGRHVPLKQLGTVIIEDDVEIGANTTIDRARFKTTKIGRGTKIDNLVQIAHGVTIGEHNLIISQTGIAGSSKTGHHVVLAGQVGIVGHISIGDGVVLAARSAVSKSIEQSGIYSGAPAIPIKEFNEQAVYLRNIRKLVKRIEALENKSKEK